MEIENFIASPAGTGHHYRIKEKNMFIELGVNDHVITSLALVTPHHQVGSDQYMDILASIESMLGIEEQHPLIKQGVLRYRNDSQDNTWDIDDYDIHISTYDTPDAVELMLARKDGIALIANDIRTSQEVPHETEVTPAFADCLCQPMLNRRDKRHFGSFVIKGDVEVRTAHEQEQIGILIDITQTDLSALREWSTWTKLSPSAFQDTNTFFFPLGVLTDGTIQSTATFAPETEQAIIRSLAADEPLLLSVTAPQCPSMPWKSMDDAAFTPICHFSL